MNRLSEIRKERNLKMSEMAKLIGIPYTTYVGYEKGERHLYSEPLKLISKKLGVSADYILGVSDKKMPDTQTSAGHREEEYEEPENILRDYVMRAYSLHPENFVKLKEYLELLVLSQKDEDNK